MQVFVLVEKNAPGKGRGQPLGDQVFPETRNPKPESPSETRLIPEIRNSKPGTWDLEPKTPYPKPETRKPLGRHQVDKRNPKPKNLTIETKPSQNPKTPKPQNPKLQIPDP